VRIVLSIAPPRDARRIAEALVASGTAACVNVVPGVRSVYRWKGRIERARESLLVVKTSARALSSCVRALRRAHPYDVPEALALTPNAGLTDYVSWIAENAVSRRS
jgi:periplasmic divalent cation tolerance protein